MTWLLDWLFSIRNKRDQQGELQHDDDEEEEDEDEEEEWVHSLS